MTKKQEEEFEEKYDETAEDYLERHGRKATKKNKDKVLKKGRIYGDPVAYIQ